MKRTGIGAILALAAALCSGCGTVFNLTDGVFQPNADPEDSGPKVYGGVKADFDYFAGGQTTGLDVSKASAVLLVAELPMTLIGDTLTLPIAIWAQEKRAAAVAERQASQKENGELSHSGTVSVSLGQPRPSTPSEVVGVGSENR